MNAPAGRLLILFASVGALIAAAPISSAQADVVDGGTCNSSPLSQPFAPWGDTSSYALAPGGDFESSGWTLSNGAQVVAGSEPFAATRTLGASSLSLPAGASAVSPSTCVNAAYPTLRFFVAGTGAVLVQVVYNGKAIPTGLALASGNWAPSPVLMTGGAIIGAFSGGTAQVSLRLTALTGHPQVDDVFIDPWNRS
jgi:hypothetical protein